jgi:hypothetical protein
MSTSSQRPRINLGFIMNAATQELAAIANVMAKMEIHIPAPCVGAECAIQLLEVSVPAPQKGFAGMGGCLFSRSISVLRQSRLAACSCAAARQSEMERPETTVRRVEPVISRRG